MMSFRERVKNFGQRLDKARYRTGPERHIWVVWAQGRAFINEGGGLDINFLPMLQATVKVVCGIPPENQVVGYVVQEYVVEGVLNCRFEGHPSVNLLLEEKDFVWVC